MKVIKHCLLFFLLCVSQAGIAQTAIYKSSNNNLHYNNGEVDQGLLRCVADVRAGVAQFYTPSFLNGHKSLLKGERLVSLEGNACVKMRVFDGTFAWVAQEARMAQFVVDTTNTINRRYDCGNKVLSVIYVSKQNTVAQNIVPETQVTPVVVQSEPLPKVKESIVWDSPAPAVTVLQSGYSVQQGIPVMVTGAWIPDYFRNNWNPPYQAPVTRPKPAVTTQPPIIRPSVYTR